MRAEDWLKEAARRLVAVGVPSARLDSLVFLEDCVGKDRAYLLAHPELELSREQLNKLNKKIKRRLKHEPLAYIRGFTEFYGRRFKINKRVLEPRPESETMIDLLKTLKLPKALLIADIGTGSGALGITAKLEIPEAQVDLYDIDSACLAVARHNCALHELQLQTLKRDLLSRPAKNYELILANLPYVPDTWKINQAAAQEPKIAIFGGPDGLDLYRRLFGQISTLTARPKYVLTEALPPQHKKLTAIAKAAGYNLSKGQDFISVFKNQA